MEIKILTGNGEVSKRDYLLKMKRQFDRQAVIEVDLAKEDVGTLEEAILSTPLFTDKRLVIGLNPSPQLDLSKLHLVGDERLTLVFMVGSLAPSTPLSRSAALLQGEVLVFDEEKDKSIFPFLDSLIEGKVGAFSYLMKLTKEYGGMYLLTMIYYLWRRNLLPLPKASFLKNKIQRQREKFSLSDWRYFYQEVLEIEYQMKTGVVSEQMASLLAIERILRRSRRE